MAVDYKDQNISGYRAGRCKNDQDQTNLMCAFKLLISIHRHFLKNKNIGRLHAMSYEQEKNIFMNHKSSPISKTCFFNQQEWHTTQGPKNIRHLLRSLWRS